MNKNNALIVEDRTITAMDLSVILKKLGYTTKSVKSGEEALEIFNNDNPDLVLMDIMLKGYYTGLETAELIRSRSAVPIIFITALNDDETFIKVHMLEPSVIISKPYSEVIIKRLVLEIQQGITLNA